MPRRTFPPWVVLVWLGLWCAIAWETAPAHGDLAPRKAIDVFPRWSRSPVVGEVYPPGRTLSPITRRVAFHLRQIAKRNRHLHADRFSKVGASATVNWNYLSCLAGTHVRLGAHVDLVDTLAYFNRATRNPFRRRSLAAGIGWHAGRAVWGRPSPLRQEVHTMHPRFAVAMYGTNDIELHRPGLFGALLYRIATELSERGVIPILSTTLPRDDDPRANRRVPLYNAVIRSVAQLESIPLIDLHREIMRLPQHGMASDGVHPSVLFESGTAQACDFTPAGLAHGYNLRNLLTLRALAKARRPLTDPRYFEPGAPPPSGRGTLDEPIRVAALPFASAGDLVRASSPSSPICQPSGPPRPQIVYRLRLAEPAHLMAVTMQAERAPGAERTLTLALRREDACVFEGREGLDLRLEAGEHDLVVTADTPSASARLQSAVRFAIAIARIDR